MAAKKNDPKAKKPPLPVDVDAESKREITVEELEKRRLSEEMVLRKQFAYVMVGLVGVTNIIAIIMLFFVGFKVHNFYLSDTIIVSLISATVADLAGLFLIVMKYLFNLEGRQKQKGEES